MPDVIAKPLAAVPFLQLDDRGEASLVGSHCEECGATIAGKKSVCPCCSARDKMRMVRLGERGKVYTYTVVHRSFPGVKTPFVAVIVDLEGGGSLQGVLLDGVPTPTSVAYDMPVDVVYRDSGQRDKTGRPFISYYFVPAQGEA